MYIHFFLLLLVYRSLARQDNPILIHELLYHRLHQSHRPASVLRFQSLFHFSYTLTLYFLQKRLRPIQDISYLPPIHWHKYELLDDEQAPKVYDRQTLKSLQPALLHEGNQSILALSLLPWHPPYP